MITRYNRKWLAPAVKSCPVKHDYELIKKIIPISFNEDKSVKEYKEEESWVDHKSKWCDYIKSFDIGSPSEQILEHLMKGTPLITAHSLPHGDYTSESLLKGAEIVREMKSKGVTLEMIESALKASTESSESSSTDLKGE